MSRPHPLQPRDLDPQQPPRHDDGPDLLSQVQVCQRLGISDETWRRWRRALRTPDHVTLPSGRLKWRASDIAALVGRREERTPRRGFFGRGREAGAGQFVAVDRVRHSAHTVAPSSSEGKPQPLVVKVSRHDR